MSGKVTEDEQVFGKTKIVYCNQHLNAHYTGWCTVSVRNKTLLEATDLRQAADECRTKGFKLFEDIQK